MSKYCSKCHKEFRSGCCDQHAYIDTEDMRGVCVFGNTFDNREDLRRAGFNWIEESKVWVVEHELTLAQYLLADQILSEMDDRGLNISFIR